jgi:hypothetical protein
MDMVFTLLTTPQTSLSSFKTLYRPSLEAAVVQSLQMPMYELALGDVVVLDVIGLNNYQQSRQYAFESGAGTAAGLVALGSRCNRNFTSSARRSQVDVKVTVILENAGYSSAEAAFDSISGQLVQLVDSRALENTTNQFLPQYNSPPLPSPLSTSCLYANFVYSEISFVRTAAPTFAPTEMPFTENEQHTVWLLASAALFVAVVLLAIVALFERYFDQSSTNYPVTSTGVLGSVEDSSFLGYKDPYSLGVRLQQTPLDALMDTVHIIKSAVPYMEWIRHIDFMMFHGLPVRSIGDRLRPLEYLRYVLGGVDPSLLQCVWLQHRYLSFLAHAQGRTRVVRIISVIYFGIMVLCFVCLLVLYLEQLPPARYVANDFALQCIIYCSMTALFASTCYGPLEASIFYVFGRSQIDLDPLAVSLSGDNLAQPVRLRDGLSGSHPHGIRANNSAKIGLDRRFSSRIKASVQPLSSPLRSSKLRAPATPSNRFSRAGRKRGGKNKKQARSSFRPDEQNARIKTPIRQGVSSFQPRANTPHPVKRDKKAKTVKLRSSQRILVSHAFLPSESLIDELSRLQTSISYCRRDLHMTFMENRESYVTSSDHDARRSLSDASSEDGMGMTEANLADAALAVQFDAVWGLGESGKFMDSQISTHDIHSYIGSFFRFWYRVGGLLFLGHRGDAEFSEPELADNGCYAACLKRLALDLVKHRRSVFNERLLEMQDILSVQSTVAPNDKTTKSFNLNSRSCHSYRIYYMSSNSVPLQSRRRIVQLFHLDVLPPLSASIVKGQIDRHKWVTAPLYGAPWARLLASVMLAAVFVVFVFVIYYVSVEQLTNKGETAVLIIYLSWFVLDVVVVSTASLWVRHALIPCLAHADMLAVIRWLINSLLAHRADREVTPNGSNNTSQSLDGSESSRVDFGSPWENRFVSGPTMDAGGDLESGIERMESEMPSRIDIEAIVAPLEESLYVEDFFSDARRPASDPSLELRREEGSSDSGRMDDQSGARPVLLGEIVPDASTRPGIAEFNSAEFVFQSNRMAKLNMFSNSCSPENFVISLFHTIWPRRSYMPVDTIRNQFGQMISGSSFVAWLHLEPMIGTAEEPSVESGVVASGQEMEGVEAVVPEIAGWLSFPDTLMQKSSSFRKKMKQFCVLLLYFYVDYLPLAIQDWLVELVVWSCVLWLVYLHVYALHTIPVLVVFPALLGFVLIVALTTRFLGRFEFGAPFDDVDHVLYYPDQGEEALEGGGGDGFQESSHELGGEEEQEEGNRTEQDRVDYYVGEYGQTNEVDPSSDSGMGRADTRGRVDDDNSYRDPTATAAMRDGDGDNGHADSLEYDTSMHSEIGESQYSEQTSAIDMDSDSGYTLKSTPQSK